MAMFAASRKTVTADQFFNPYKGLAPPDCCYCAPTGIVVNPGEIEIQNQIQAAVTLEVSELLPGMTSLAFTTRAEDAFRTLARGRIEARGKAVIPGTLEMGHGPYSFGKRRDRFGL